MSGIFVNFSLLIWRLGSLERGFQGLSKEPSFQRIRPLVPIRCSPLLLPLWSTVFTSYLAHYYRYQGAVFCALLAVHTRTYGKNFRPIRRSDRVLHLYQCGVSPAVILSAGSISPRSGRVRIRRAFKTCLKHALNTLPAAHRAGERKQIPEYEVQAQTEQNAIKIPKFHGVLVEIW